MQSMYMSTLYNYYYRGISNDIRDLIKDGYRYFGSSYQASANIYLSGSVIKKISLDQVYFENNLLPVGSVIYRWEMVANFDTSRSVPTLPILIPNMVYQVSVKATLREANSLYLRILFYNYAEEIVDIKIIKSLDGKFIYPVEADFYAIELVSAGLKSMYFHRLDIVPLTIDTENLSQEQVEALYIQQEKKNR
ncbi:accessory Sec system protein Asp3 [Limosilactobacillus equigenerosi]|uniref:accessory Sec system protein Asp3 n=1 Tax=Limosilactobacillus equigenerosi TaxID=417373 RepID=UPI0006D0949D|nr:accessory Sec system protein Asp3 [Limosilactobacillus equigenerosi]